MFSFDSEPTRNTLLARNRGNEPGNQFESGVHSVFRFADGMIICLIKQGLSLSNRNILWDLLTIIDELQRQACSKIGIGGRPSRIYWISKRTISLTRRIIYEGKSASRNSDTEFSRDAGNEESSRITSRHILNETIRRLTSQLQEMQEQMKSLNDSGDFQEVDSNHSGRLSYVPSQPAAIPSSRSFLSRYKRLLLTHRGIRLFHRKTFSVFFWIWFVPKSSSGNSPLCDTRRDRIS